jgi:hypothetical protein
VDYKPNATESRKVGKDDMSGLDKQLEVMHTRIQDISREIEHARKQEIAMKEAGGKSFTCCCGKLHVLGAPCFLS